MKESALSRYKEVGGYAKMQVLKPQWRKFAHWSLIHSVMYCVQGQIYVIIAAELCLFSEIRRLYFDIQKSVISFLFFTDPFEELLVTSLTSEQVRGFNLLFFLFSLYISHSFSKQKHLLYVKSYLCFVLCLVGWL